MNFLFKILLLLLSINSIKPDSELSKPGEEFCNCDKILAVPIQRSKISGRIYNGRNATKNELSYVGLIYNKIYLGENITNDKKDPYGYSRVCTGFLINQDYAITSGDCASFIKEDPIVFKTSFFALGSRYNHDIRKARKDATYVRQIKDVYIHPDFNEKTLDNNIGVIEFQSPFVLGPNSKIEAACLFNTRFNSSSEKLYTAGYGFTKITKIKRPQFPIYDTETSRLQVMIGSETKKDCKKGKICLLNADAGTCPQDGGGPLLYNYEGKAFVIGINDRIDKMLREQKTKPTDDDYDKCERNVQTEFTPIGLYTDWIRNNFGFKCM